MIKLKKYFFALLPVIYLTKNIEGSNTSHILVYNMDRYCMMYKPLTNRTRSISDNKKTLEMRNYVMRVIKERSKNLFNNLSNERSLKSFSVHGQYHQKLNAELLTFTRALSESMVSNLVDSLPCVEFHVEDYEIDFQDEQPDQPYAEFYAQEQADQTNPRLMQYLRKSEILFGNQWYYDPSYKFSTHVPKEYVSWAQTADTKPVRIAIVDTGCDLKHPAFKQTKFWRNKDEICNDGIDNDNNGYIDDCIGFDFANNIPLEQSPDSEGHGTALAAIIASNSQNLLGGCFNCEIMCLKFRKKNQSNISRLLSSLDYAIDKKADIVNLSFGTVKISKARQLEYLMIKKLASYGILVVASAGNNGVDNDVFPHFPSGFTELLDNMITVGSTLQNGEVAKWSNYGKLSLNIFAPGKDILSAKVGNNYRLFAGTSFSTAIVSAIAGQILSRNKFTYSDVKRIILGGCVDNLNGTKGQCSGVANSTASMMIVDKILKENMIKKSFLKSFFSSLI